MMFNHVAVDDGFNGFTCEVCGADVEADSEEVCFPAMLAEFRDRFSEPQIVSDITPEKLVGRGCPEWPEDGYSLEFEKMVNDWFWVEFYDDLGLAAEAIVDDYLYVWSTEVGMHEDLLRDEFYLVDPDWYTMAVGAVLDSDIDDPVDEIITILRTHG